MTNKEFNVGDKVFIGDVSIIGKANGEMREGTITKVGRRWVYYSHGRSYESRFQKDDPLHRVDGQALRAFRSIAEYEEEKTRDRAWSELKEVVRHWSAPSDIETKDILSALHLLGGKLT